jgi:hypothetical protein
LTAAIQQRATMPTIHGRLIEWDHLDGGLPQTHRKPQPAPTDRRFKITKAREPFWEPNHHSHPRTTTDPHGAHTAVVGMKAERPD